MKKLKFKFSNYKLILTVCSILMIGNVSAQSTATDTLTVQSTKPIPVEFKSSIATFYIVNDKPASYEEYINHLLKKEDETNSTSTPQ